MRVLDAVRAWTIAPTMSMKWMKQKTRPRSLRKMIAWLACRVMKSAQLKQWNIKTYTLPKDFT
jgi:hypothetical protein